MDILFSSSYFATFFVTILQPVLVILTKITRNGKKEWTKMPQYKECKVLDWQLCVAIVLEWKWAIVFRTNFARTAISEPIYPAKSEPISLTCMSYGAFLHSLCLKWTHFTRWSLYAAASENGQTVKRTVWLTTSVMLIRHMKLQRGFSK